MIQLRVISGPHSGLKLDLAKSSVLLGRSKNCDLVLKLDSHVSRVHGEIFRTGSRLSYQDLGSKTGSVIESAGSSTKLGLFLPKCPLRNRDRIRTLLVECAWCSLKYNPWARATYERIHGGKQVRRKKAAVALARRILVVAWAMLRDESDYDPNKLLIKPPLPSAGQVAAVRGG